MPVPVLPLLMVKPEHFIFQLSTKFASIVFTASFTRHQQILLFYIKLEDLHNFGYSIKRIYSLHEKSNFMAEPTLAQVFGANASQTSTDLVIKKSDLAAVGLTAAVINTAESLLLAITLTAQTGLTEDTRDTNIDQSVAITDGFSPSITTRNNAIYLRNTISVEVDKLLSGADVIDPDDY